jgi:DNA-directed RNA polymerase specialized sigma24 family protein
LQAKNEMPPASVRSGFDVAEEMLLDPHEVARLMRLARLQFGIEEDDALDLLQETALDVVRTRAPVEHPRAFVTRVFYRQCCQYVRRAVRSRSRVSGGSFPDVAAPDGAAVEDLLALRQA